jgi:hypothetical protein
MSAARYDGAAARESNVPITNPFARKSAPASPAVQDITLAEFTTMARATAGFAAFEGKFGRQMARDTILLLYDRHIRMMTNNQWSPANADYTRPATPNPMLRVPPAVMATFNMMLGEYFLQDVSKTAGRELHLQNLKGAAMTGQLRRRLQAQTAGVDTYYQAPVRVPRPGAPAVPPKPAAAVNRNEAIAWISGNLTGASVAGSPYRKAIEEYGSADASAIPSLTTLKTIWRLLVSDPPSYRSVNILQPTKYPSSEAGEWLLNDRIRDLSTVALPAVGDDQWYDWALYLFALIMTSQGFTDGNKRVARTAYAIVLRKGGVDFKAPSAALGGALADM